MVPEAPVASSRSVRGVPSDCPCPRPGRHLARTGQTGRSPAPHEGNAARIHFALAFSRRPGSIDPRFGEGGSPEPLMARLWAPPAATATNPEFGAGTLP